MSHNVSCHTNQFDLLRMVCTVMNENTSLNDTVCGLLDMPLPRALRIKLVNNVVRFVQIERMHDCHFEMSFGLSLRHVETMTYNTFMDVDEFGDSIRSYSYADTDFHCARIGEPKPAHTVLLWFGIAYRHRNL